MLFLAEELPSRRRAEARCPRHVRIAAALDLEVGRQEPDRTGTLVFTVKRDVRRVPRHRAFAGIHLFELVDVGHTPFADHPWTLWILPSPVVTEVCSAGDLPRFPVPDAASAIFGDKRFD